MVFGLRSGLSGANLPFSMSSQVSLKGVWPGLAERQLSLLFTLVMPSLALHEERSFPSKTCK